MHSLQALQRIQQSKINSNSGALNMKTPKPMFEWTDQEIIEYYDQDPNITLQTYSSMLGLSVEELKEILMQ